MAGLAGLNALLAMYRLLPDARASWVFLPVPELILVLLPVFLGVAAGRAGQLRYPLAGAVIGTLLSAYSLGEGAIQFLYSRPWEPVADYPLIRGGILLISPGDGAVVDVIMTAILLATAFAMFAVFFTVLLLVGFLLTRELVRRPTAARNNITLAAATIIVLAIAGMVSSSPDQALSVRFVGALQGDDFTLEPAYSEDRSGPPTFEGKKAPSPRREADVDEQIEDGQTQDYGAPGFRDRDIYKFIVESYGITIFENEEIEEVVVPKIEKMGARLERAGYHSVSNFIRAPILGGQSWLAEATFLTGNEIDRQGRYEQLMKEGSRSIVRELDEKANYYSLAIKPGAINGHWNNEAEVFGFSEVMTAYEGDFGYEGPWFSFVPIPDQFAIRQAHKRIEELRSEDGAAVDRPLYLHYQLVSSHLPFSRIPEFFDDWDALGDGSVYHNADNTYFDNDYISGEDYIGGYNASIKYVLEVITHYMENHIPEDDESLFLIYGDHQPGPQIRGDTNARAVPIHVLSRDETILEVWKDKYEYVPGMIPTQDGSFAAMADMFSKMTGIASRSPNQRSE